ncbi:hypothetical protein NEUTE1DRAFT_138023 [Neurospora tetrasperma FGSC 2508]|uniref:Store-operated calcium entry-associated regulatory factor n=1 Tax=Neurospora tetrasperma (strain FGSC 2508 / ATCC MYA-4615 / P0657) TaxID=510951 RepID=F8MKR4_NEUT8|nr:uncharacterized protein NEUTE1DRAFT_138023 [Neurospora tetrasperma FGSC 2508]EGO58292.1 hypothetical protein NEUTE1DRAFT_138023 [Neurospora tetrasperma FGSC 2508]EGZ71390.1 DUF1183-domain-containing protein [Neurospora tetrasperma FGSC 2509]
MRLLDPSSSLVGVAALLFLSSLPNGPRGAEAAKSGKAKDAVLLSNIRSLTLLPNSKTTGRRLPPIPQLTCTSSRTLCALASPHISLMRCTNQGPRYDKEDIQWSCTVPSLPTTLQLGSTDVICEGYDGPDDNYVLKGSCGVEYTLALTEEGRRKYGHGHGGWGGGDQDGEEGENKWAGYLFGVLFVGVLGWIVYSACVQAGVNRGVPGAEGQRRGWGGGGGGPGGGGGGGDWNDPPPPYPGYGNKPSGSQQQSGQQQQQQGWRPGFWSGLAGGAAAGYLAGQRGRGREEYDHRNRGYNYGSTWGSSSGSRNRSWGSSSSRSYSGGDNGGSSGTTTHESTGFGSTSRR